MIELFNNGFPLSTMAVRQVLSTESVKLIYVCTNIKIKKFGPRDYFFPNAARIALFSRIKETLSNIAAGQIMTFIKISEISLS